MSNTEGWLRLAEVVKRRRADRAWTQLDVHVQGGPSIDRIQAIESARTDGYSSHTIAKLERGLEWETGSVAAILAGGEPTPTDNQPTPPAREMQPEIEQLQARLEEMDRRIAEMERRIGQQEHVQDGHRGRDAV